MAKSLKHGKLTESKEINENGEDMKLGSAHMNKPNADAASINAKLGLPGGKPAITGDEEGDEPLKKNVKAAEHEMGLAEADGDKNDEDVGDVEKKAMKEQEDKDDLVKLEADDCDDEKPMKESQIAESDADIMKKLDEAEKLEETKDVPLNETLDKLFEGQNLTKEFKNRVAAIFEATVNAKTKLVKENIKKKALDVIKEQRLKNMEKMVETLDKMANTTARAWMVENQLAVFDAVSQELSEGAIQTLKSFLCKYNVRVPRSRENLVEKLQSTNTSLRAKLDKALQANMQLQENLADRARKEAIEVLAEGLSDTEKAKFVALAEDLDFTDEKSYRTKLKSIKEGLFSGAPAEKSAEDFAAKMTMTEIKKDEKKVLAEDENVNKYLDVINNGQF